MAEVATVVPSTCRSTAVTATLSEAVAVTGTARCSPWRRRPVR